MPQIHPYYRPVQLRCRKSSRRVERQRSRALPNKFATMMAPPRGMPGGYGQQPGIILLREGTDTSQGKAQLISNINACGDRRRRRPLDAGPAGHGQAHVRTKVCISNDGATIMKLLDIVHPAAALAEIRHVPRLGSRRRHDVRRVTCRRDAQAGEALRRGRVASPDDRAAAQGRRVDLEETVEVAVDMPPDQRRRRLEILAGTALNSKLIANYKDLFAPMVVDAVIALDPLLLDLKLVGVKKVPGGECDGLVLRQGVAFKKAFSTSAGVRVLPRGAVDARRRCRRAAAHSPRAPRHDTTRTGTPASSR